MIVPGLEWLKTLCEDADPARTGFQASWLYVAWNVFFPAAFGVATALFVRLSKKVFSGPSERKDD